MLTRLLLLTLLGRLGRRAVRIFGEQGVGRRLGTLGIAEFLLAGDDVGQRVRRLGVLRPLGDDHTLGVDGLLAIAQRVMGVAKPVLRVRGQGAVRIGLDEGVERLGGVLDLVGLDPCD